jgi:PTS system glucose-specific IIA component
MTLLGNLIEPNQAPKNAKAIPIMSPLNGKVIPLSEVPDPLFTHRLYGEGVAIQPAGFKLLAPFDGVISHFPELANQIRLKAKNGLHLQIQLGIGSEAMHGEGFKRLKKPQQTFKIGETLAEFSLPKMKTQLTSVLCPVTILNNEKVKGVEGHYYSVVASQDKIMTVYV